MKANEVIKLLKITRQTLYNYTKNGTLKVIKKSNGRYDYDDDSVFSMTSKNPRINVMYCRVSTKKQKDSLSNQQELISIFAINKGIIISKKYEDIESGMTLDREQFKLLLDSVFNFEIDTIYITNKDRLTRLSFKLIEDICAKFGTKIIAINDIEKTDEQELLSDIISLIHTFSMKVYSKRRKSKMDILGKELELEREVKIE